MNTRAKNPTHPLSPRQAVSHRLPDPHESNSDMTDSIFPPITALISHQRRLIRSDTKTMAHLVDAGHLHPNAAETYLDHSNGILASLEELLEIKNLIAKKKRKFSL